MKVSVAMATFNGSRFIQEQLDSLINQDHLPDELVVSDDASTDATRDIVSSFAKRAPFVVRLVCNDVNIGYVRNFERAISLCSGSHIFMCDQDDVWLRTKISRVMAEFESDAGIQVVVNDQLIVDENLRGTGLTKLQNLRSIGYSELQMHTGCCTAVTQLWRDYCLPFPEGLKGHDIWVSRLAIALGVRRYIDEGLQLYRRHSSNVTSWIVSGTRKITIARMVTSGGLRDASGGWRRDLLLTECLLRQLMGRPETAKICKDVDLASVLADLEANRLALERRIIAVSTSRLRRLPNLIRNLHAGDYKYFAGWKSFMKDCIR